MLYDRTINLTHYITLFITGFLEKYFSTCLATAFLRGGQGLCRCYRCGDLMLQVVFILLTFSSIQIEELLQTFKSR